MSFFSGQLQRLLEEGHKQNALASAAKISQGQFSKYVSGQSRPDSESLNKLCVALPEKDRALVIMAHLRDEMPDCARDLIAIVTKKPSGKSSARVREEAELPLPPLVREAFDFFEQAASSDQDIADWIVAAYKVVK